MSGSRLILERADGPRRRPANGPTTAAAEAATIIVPAIFHYVSERSGEHDSNGLKRQRPKSLERTHSRERLWLHAPLYGGRKRHGGWRRSRRRAYQLERRAIPNSRLVTEVTENTTEEHVAAHSGVPPIMVQRPSRRRPPTERIRPHAVGLPSVRVAITGPAAE